MTDKVLSQTFEPKREHRFLIKFPAEFGIPSWVIHKASRPRIELGYNGEYRCNPVILKLYDPIGPSTTQRVWDIYIGLSGADVNEIYPTIHKGLYSDLKEKFTKFKDGFDIGLEMLDPTGITVESWDFVGCYISRFDFGALSYDSDKQSMCTLEIQPRHFRLNF